MTKHLRRGMSVLLPDGSIEIVTSTFRFPANTKYRKAGRRMFQSENWIFHTLDDIKILGFIKQ